ncbi:dienelactone hydrolase family protein [Salinibacterium sp. SYSU T00001]|uniref:dienelactone hydrolase family protein n=1 Tax=Homoserinimonas sedimenticola TaxID=2986805 RepID=UPI00223642D6|nr:dienelactone hydrolase family protein [Salinibacterium sedimenticola]MCW4385667.1 dienelactone hydrolase family protein [Salinibacterium sedimenticola]
MTTRDIEYSHDGTRMIGYLSAPEGAQGRPGILLIHDAFGLSDDMKQLAERYAGLGFAVFAADVWGERTTPTSEPEIGPLIGAMVGDRPRWLARIRAAHEAFEAQPEVDADSIVAIGYCFGGSSALEHLRTGGRLRGVVAVHAGLDLLAPGWEAATASASVLICTGAEDPMATDAMRAELQAGLSGAGIDWELDLYSDTVHAFTNPKSAHSPNPAVIAYNPRSAKRSWQATERFLAELFPSTEGAPHA